MARMLPEVGDIVMVAVRVRGHDTLYRRPGVLIQLSGPETTFFPDVPLEEIQYNAGTNTFVWVPPAPAPETTAAVPVLEAAPSNVESVEEV